MKRLSPLCIVLFLTSCLTTSSLFGQKQKTSNGIDPTRIDIVRDSFGVAHIFAPTDAECAYGVAWATCEDDFELPQWFLMAITGNMGRYEGKDGAAIDFAVKWSRVNERVEERYLTEISPRISRSGRGICSRCKRIRKDPPQRGHLQKVLPHNRKRYRCGPYAGAGPDGRDRWENP